MPDLQVSWRVFEYLLEHAPSTTNEIIDATGCRQSAVQKAIQRMTKRGVVKLAGRGPRRPGRTSGSTPYIIDMGPKVRAWAAANVKPPRDDE